jgi:hypothetical protein
VFTGLLWKKRRPYRQIKTVFTRDENDYGVQQSSIWIAGVAAALNIN